MTSVISVAKHRATEDTEDTEKGLICGRPAVSVVPFFSVTSVISVAENRATEGTETGMICGGSRTPAEGFLRDHCG